MKSRDEYIKEVAAMLFAIPKVTVHSAVHQAIMLADQFEWPEDPQKSKCFHDWVNRQCVHCGEVG